MRTVLITGANRGIGFEAARQLSARGFRVFVASRDERKGELALLQLNKEARNTNASAELIVMDVAKNESIAAAAAEFASRADCLDVLINNSGILLDEHANIQELSSEILQETLTTNTFGPLRVAQAFLR